MHVAGMRTLNILVVDNSEYPLTYGYMQEIFGRFLVERGHSVTWLLLSKEASKRGESKRLGSTEVVLAPLKAGKGRLATMLNYLFYKPLLGRLFPRVIRERNVDVVFVRNHVRIGLAAYRACRRAKIPFVYYLGYPTLESHRTAARLGYRRPRIVAEAAALAGIPIRNRVTRCADFVYTMSGYWADLVVNELGVAPGRVDSLPAGFDPRIDPKTLDGKGVRKRFGLADRPVVFYMGTISPPRDSSILVAIMERVVRSIPDARMLLLYGHGEERYLPVLRKKFAAAGILGSVVLVPPVPYREIPDYIAAADVGLSPIETIPLYNVSSPYKFTEMLGLCCPVVASDTPDQSYVLKSSGGGVCVPYDADAFASAVVRLLSHPDEARRMGERGRDFVLNERSYDILAEKLERCFYALIGMERVLSGGKPEALRDHTAMRMRW